MDSICTAGIFDLINPKPKPRYVIHFMSEEFIACYRTNRKAYVYDVHVVDQIYNRSCRYVGTEPPNLQNMVELLITQRWTL